MVAASKDPDGTSSNGNSPQEPSNAQGDDDPHRVESLVGLIRHAYLRLLAGDSGDARHTLERALASEGCGSLPVLSASTMRLQSFPTPGTSRALVPPSPSYTKRAISSSPIVVKTLGTFEVKVNGKQPGVKRKPPHRLLSILKVLIAKGGCAVNRSALVDVLWPDLDGDRANDAQQVALHRLRRLLGHPDALVINHGYISLNSQLVDVDAFILDSLCRNPYISSHQERASTALKLYKGMFLPEELESPWTQRMRECMRAKFVNIIAVAGKELESLSDFSGAAELYERALGVADLENIVSDGLVRALRRGKAARRQPKASFSTAG